MAYIDCFNGDADGLCALVQIRLHNPVKSTLITGVKRDIGLLTRASAQSQDIVTVLDVSLDKNRTALEQVLANGAEVFYCDHHFSGEIPEHPKLTALINTSPDVCTSLLVNKTLKGRFLAWAVVGTYGDNLSRSAKVLAKPLNLNDQQLAQLQELGVLLNYNGYGSQLEDLYFDPADLFKRIVQYASPFDFMQDDIDTFETLQTGYKQDMQYAADVEPTFAESNAAVYQLPDASWARRVSGVFGNDLANQFPGRAHAVVTEKGAGIYVVSVRAPLNNKQGADKICRQFETGGGRAAAAGINALPADQLEHFIDVFSSAY